MKKIIITESQLKNVIDHLVNEQENYMNTPNKDLTLYGKVQKGKQTRQYYKPDALASRAAKRTNIEAGKLIFTQKCDQPWSKNAVGDLPMEALTAAMKNLEKELVGKWIEPITWDNRGQKIGPASARIVAINPERLVSPNAGFFGGGTDNTYSYDILDIELSGEDKTFANGITMAYPLEQRNGGGIKRFVAGRNSGGSNAGYEENLLNFLNCYFSNGWPQGNQSQPQGGIQESHKTKLRLEQVATGQSTQPAQPAPGYLHKIPYMVGEKPEGFDSREPMKEIADLKQQVLAKFPTIRLTYNAYKNGRQLDVPSYKAKRVPLIKDVKLTSVDLMGYIGEKEARIRFSGQQPQDAFDCVIVGGTGSDPEGGFTGKVAGYIMIVNGVKVNPWNQDLTAFVNDYFSEGVWMSWTGTKDWGEDMRPKSEFVAPVLKGRYKNMQNTQKR